MGLVLPQSFHAATFMFLSVTKSREIYVNQIIHVEIRTRAKGEKRAQEQTNNPRYDDEKTKSSSQKSYDAKENVFILLLRRRRKFIILPCGVVIINCKPTNRRVVYR